MAKCADFCIIQSQKETIHLRQRLGVQDNSFSGLQPALSLMTAGLHNKPVDEVIKAEMEAMHGHNRLGFLSLWLI